MLAHPCMLLWGVTGLGTGLALLLPVGATPWSAALLVALLLLWRTLHSRQGVVLAALAVVLTAAGLRSALYVAPPVATVCQADSLWRVTVDGPIDRMQDADGSVRQRTAARLEQEFCAGVWQPRQGRARVRLWAGADVHRGDALQLRLRVRSLAPARNPGDADPEFLARRLHISQRAQVLSPHVLIRAEAGVWSSIDALRHSASRAFEQELAPPWAALGKAFALGDQTSIAPERRDAWSDAGIAHLLSVSGLHVGMIAVGLFFLLRWGVACLPGVSEWYVSRRLAAWLCMPAVALFCCMAGASPPTLRSGIMACATLLGVALGTPGAGLNALGLAGSVLLLADPLAICDPGFLLSFAAVAALLLTPAARQHAESPWLRAWHLLQTSLVLSSVVTVVTAPITACFLGASAGWAPLSNLVAVPLGSGLATPLALLFIMLRPLWPSGAQAVAQGLTLVLQALDHIATFFAAVPGAGLDVARPTAPELVLFGALLLLAGTAWHTRQRRTWQYTTGCAVLLACVVLWRQRPSPGDGLLSVTHAYVGQGDGALVQFPHGTTMLVDAGGAILPQDPDPGRGVIAPLLRARRLRHIDIAVLTHPHPDHINGMAYIARHWPIRTLWYSGAGADNPVQTQILADVQARGGVVRRLTELPVQQLIDGVQVQLLHPRPPPDEGGTYPELHANDNSIVVQLTYGTRSVLLAGDVEANGEDLLAPTLGPVDVLKAPHHGSRTSSNLPLLAAATPQAVVISCGEDNQFGFPHAEVLARYAAMDVQVWRTDIDGQVSLSTDGVNLRLQGHTGRTVHIASRDN